MSCSVTLKQGSFTNDGFTICRNLDLHVTHKEKVAIIGPNGSGKTTLLDIIAGLRFLDAGTLEIFHHKVTCNADFKNLRPMIGYLLQDSDNQFLAPTVIDDVAFSLRCYGASAHAALLKAQMMLEDLGIAHLRDKIVYKLSGGEKKLVALAGVLICEPKLMLLDEPTNGLDQDMQLRLIAILQRIDKSIIIVSHNREFVDKVVDKIYTISTDGLSILGSDES